VTGSEGEVCRNHRAGTAGPTGKGPMRREIVVAATVWMILRGKEEEEIETPKEGGGGENSPFLLDVD